MEKEKKLYDILNELHIHYKRHEHPPVFTVEDAQAYWKDIDGIHCKNLFFRNQKGKIHYLIVLKHNKKLDIEALTEKTGAGKMSFASEKRLDKYLGLKQGSVSPFGLINDEKREVKVFLDKDLKNGEIINFHPNVNTATITISVKDFEKFLKWCGNEITYIQV